MHGKHKKKNKISTRKQKTKKILNLDLFLKLQFFAIVVNREKKENIKEEQWKIGFVFKTLYYSNIFIYHRLKWILIEY